MHIPPGPIAEGTYRTTHDDGFDPLREVFPNLVVTIQVGNYVDHAYIERYEEPFDEEAIRKAQKVVLESTSWLIRDISWTIRDDQIRTNAIFLIRRRSR
jgi:hypothetical protein